MKKKKVKRARVMSSWANSRFAGLSSRRGAPLLCSSRSQSSVYERENARKRYKPTAGKDKNKNESERKTERGGQEERETEKERVKRSVRERKCERKRKMGRKRDRN